MVAQNKERQELNYDKLKQRQSDQESKLATKPQSQKTTFLSLRNEPIGLAEYIRSLT